MDVAALFVREDSTYKNMPGVDCYDIERDALTFPGGRPVVCHPPCRSWGRLRYFAKPRCGEKELAPWAVSQVQQWGGVLEHPTASSLWPHCDLPRPGEGVDEFGGFTIQVNQHWWGHLCEKSTWLYIVGCDRGQVPPAPLVFSEPSHVISQCSGSVKTRPEASKRIREATPPEFALFLVELASMCGQLRRAA